MKKIYAVGLGPGTILGMTPEAKEAISSSKFIVGYKTYIDQIIDLCENKEIISNGMRQEVERCKKAIEIANDDNVVSVVCSGDAGVYGMAGLIMELIEKFNYDVDVEVISGVTAALSTAAVLGSPLTNDFSVISLSDLLTPKEWIIKRLEGAAYSNMATAIYNPRSKKRVTLIVEAQKIFLAASKENGYELNAGYVRNAGRNESEQWIGKLEELPIEKIDMFTTVIIGNSMTDIINGKLVTRRGYSIE